MLRSNPVVLGRRLVTADVDAVACQRAPVTIAPAAAESMARSHEFLRRLATSDVAVYGLTTGCGPLAGHRIDAAQRAGVSAQPGPQSRRRPWARPHPTAFVRAAMLVRAQVFALGRSGVAPTRSSC